jgi:hypothetical protein
VHNPGGGRFCQSGKLHRRITSQRSIAMKQYSVPNLSKEAVRSFKEVYLEEFKEDLTDDEAEIIATRVLGLFYILEYGKADSN